MLLVLSQAPLLLTEQQSYLKWTIPSLASRKQNPLQPNLSQLFFIKNFSKNKALKTIIYEEYDVCSWRNCGENMIDEDSHIGVADVLQGSRGCEVSESRNTHWSTIYSAD